ncbi:hypothetical protein SEA_EASTWEST_34 [Arthrobacter phage EastWest]|uniref:Uncharacterized protein n=1 Tax=Arthrobacter phage EastWest TaxID=2894292 RepID=A0AAE8YP35_9CAUD|nr:hypothetical protein SEA_EASTWEST_34 [Arthrobacter phage EastWest]
MSRHKKTGVPPLVLTERGEAVANILAAVCIIVTLVAFVSIFVMLGVDPR